MRRAELSRHGRGTTPAAPPTRAPKPKPDGANAPIGDHSDGDRVTASRVGVGSQVTGIANVRFGSGIAERGTSPKVGFTRSEGGRIVSGTSIRSKIAITGDEAGASATITGEADQRLDDDLTERPAPRGPQFGRAAEPHGASVFSRRPARREAIETSDGGLPVTGTAVGTSPRVTGDEALVRSGVTGDQYVARRRDAVNRDAERHDPVSGAKVAIGLSHGRQRITGIAVEADPRVTGDDRSASSAVTGSQYVAPPRDAATPTERDFSIRTPHHSMLRRENRSDITGSFASGLDNVTGNREFFFASRRPDPDATAARMKLTGEGGSAGTRISGFAWTEQPNVTGAGSATAADRNPSKRSGSPQAFAGARHFKAAASHEDPKNLVTGMSGFSSDSGAKVTLSGGAQG